MTTAPTQIEIHPVTAPALAVGTVAAMAIGFAASGAGLIVTDAAGRIVAANLAYAALAGCRPDELNGQSLHAALDGGPGVAPRPAHTGGLPRPLPAGPWEGEATQVRRTGSRRPVRVRIETLRDRHGTTLRHVVTVIDLTGQRREQAALRRQSQRDTLTGLPNRAQFLEELTRCLARAQRHGRRLALLYIDLDGLKRVNDLLGHAAGDALLREVALRLRRSLRAQDILARVGGDEFIAIVEDLATPDGALHSAATLLAAVAQGLVVAGRGIRPSASIGAALFPDDATDAEGLVRAADAAMYRAKRDGGQRCTRAGDRGLAA